MATRLKDHLEKLQVLNAVARSGSITKAATLLRITQAAVSQSIKTLEQALNQELIIREPRGIGLTEHGRILFEFSKRLIADVEAVETQFENPNETNIGSLRIGTHETLAIHVWPQLIHSFCEEFPQIGISLIGGRIDALISSLVNYELHLTLTVEPEPRPDLVTLVVYEGCLGFYGAGSMPETITMDAAAQLPILTDASAHLRQHTPIPSLLAGRGFNLARFHEINSFEAAMRFAALGLGLAVVPDRNAQEYVKAGKIRKLNITGIDNETFGPYKICASWLKKNDAHRPLILFRKTLKTYYGL